MSRPTRLLVLLVAAVGLLRLVGSARAAGDLGVAADLDRALASFEQAQAVRDADPDRARRLFRSAAQALESVAARGFRSGPLEYNLGNCYLQAGDLGRAVLHYRRAEQLTPRDPRLQENLAEARSRRLTNLRPATRATVLKNVFFWHHQTSIVERVWAALAAYLVFWFLLGVYLLASRRWIAVTAALFAVVAASAGGSAAATYWVQEHRPAGVVLAQDTAVYKGPGTGYTRQFQQPLQPGVEFVRLETRGGWWRIALPDGNTGWIDAEHAGLV